MILHLRRKLKGPDLDSFPLKHFPVDNIRGLLDWDAEDWLHRPIPQPLFEVGFDRSISVLSAQERE